MTKELKLRTKQQGRTAEQARIEGRLVLAIRNEGPDAVRLFLGRVNGMLGDLEIYASKILTMQELQSRHPHSAPLILRAAGLSPTPPTTSTKPKASRRRRRRNSKTRSSR